MRKHKGVIGTQPFATARAVPFFAGSIVGPFIYSQHTLKQILPPAGGLCILGVVRRFGSVVLSGMRNPALETLGLPLAFYLKRGLFYDTSDCPARSL
jgi:hypothetical protein